MAAPILHLWESQGVGGNEAHEIAEYVLTLTCVPCSPYVGTLTGLAVFVEGDKGWEIEHGLDRCTPSWLGEQMAQNAVKIDHALGYVDRGLNSSDYLLYAWPTRERKRKVRNAMVYIQENRELGLKVAR